MTADGQSGIAGASAHPAIGHFHAYLAAHPQMAADSQAILDRESRARGLTFKGEPFSRYLRPHLITRSQHRTITSVVELLASAMIKLRRAMLQDHSLMDQLDLTPQERELVLVDPGFEEPSPSARLDSFWSERDWRFVEMNAESPAAIAYEDVLAELFLELPAVKGWTEENGYVLHPLYARDRFMQEIEKVWSEFRTNRGGFKERPNIAIVDWDGVSTATEFDLLAYLMRRPGRVFSREQLLSEVWGYAVAAGTRTVDVHVAQLRSKLGRTSPIRTVRGVGYAAGR